MAPWRLFTRGFGRRGIGLAVATPGMERGCLRVGGICFVEALVYVLMHWMILDDRKRTSNGLLSHKENRLV